MMQFVRKFSSKTSLMRVVALATAGSGIFCFTTSSDYNTSVSVSISSPFPDSLTWPWSTMELSCLGSSFTRSNHSHYGGLPLFFSRPDVVPDPDISKGAAREAGDIRKHSCNCLGRDTIANAASKIGPAVVSLSVPLGIFSRSTFSGTIIDENGTIVTCAHLVDEFQFLLSSSSKGKVEVTLQDGRSFEGTVLNADLHSDIAIVSIKSKTPLPAAKLGSSSKLRPGDWVVAVGCRLTLQNTVTAGIVSRVDRKISDLGPGGMHGEYLQTDCAINKDNSGGPLVNVDGEVVGVNGIKVLRSDSSNFAVPTDSFPKTKKVLEVLRSDSSNFAMPIDSVSKIIEQFKRNGRVVRPWLGVKMLDLNDMIVAHLKERNASFPDVSRGVVIPMVSPGSPADRAGFRPGDVVVEFGGSPVGSSKEVIDIMGDKIGTPFKVIVKRENSVTETLTVIPDEEANPDM